MAELPTIERASSPAPDAPAIEIPRGSADYAEWRKTGNLPQPKEAADPAPAQESSDAPPADNAAAAEPAPASEPEKKLQETTPEPRPKGAEARIKQLLAENKKLKLQIETSPRPPEPARDTARPPEPQQPAPPQSYADWRKAFKPTQWIEQYGKDNPQATYEEAQAAMFDYMGDVRDGFRQHEAQIASERREFDARMAETRSRYPDADKIIEPAARKIALDAQVAPVIKALLNDSSVFSDLMYVIGSDAGEMESLLAEARDPRTAGAAVRRLVLLENLVKQELAAKKSATPTAETAAERDASGKFVKPRAPEKTIADAPPPPTEVSGRNTPPGDAVEAAVTAGDFARYREMRNRRDLESRKG